MPPFVIFALPRSRTTWLSQWLSYNGVRVGHDIGIDCRSVQDFVDHLWSGRIAGTVETGAMVAGKLLRHAMPSARFLVVRRPVEAVEQSLSRCGVTGMREELERRDALLDSLVRDCSAGVVEYADLANPQACAEVFQYCLGVPFDPEWHRAMAERNIQTDIASVLRRTHQNAEAIAALKAEVTDLTARLDSAHPPPFVRIGVEAWDTFWPEAKPLGEAHYHEVGSDARPGPPYALDVELMAAQARAAGLMIVSARVNERLVGYCMWTLTRDVERGGVPMADQGPWYVAPDAPKGLRLGPRLLTDSLDKLRAIGFHDFDLHHDMEGRGARAGTLFRRLGAVEYQRRYSLHLGAD